MREAVQPVVISMQAKVYQRTAYLRSCDIYRDYFVNYPRLNGALTLSNYRQHILYIINIYYSKHTET